MGYPGIGKTAMVRVMGLFVSVLLAGLIIAFWLAQASLHGYPTRTESLLFGLLPLSHSRYWDAFLGLYAFAGMIVSTQLPRDERTECLTDDILFMALGAFLGLTTTGIVFRHGFTLADNQTLLIAAGIGAAWAIVALWVDRFRVVAVISVGICCGMSLCVGVLAGTILTVGLAVVYAVIVWQYRYWQRRLAHKQTA